jgi:ribosomal protein L5
MCLLSFGVVMGVVVTAAGTHCNIPSYRGISLSHFRNFGGLRKGLKEKPKMKQGNFQKVFKIFGNHFGA